MAHTTGGHKLTEGGTNFGKHIEISVDCSTDEQDYSHISKMNKVMFSVSYNQTTDVPMINLTTAREIVYVLVDSGRSISLISPDIFEN